MAARPEFLLTAEQFLEIAFPPGVKAELDNGVIRMMGGGTVAHARVQMNLYRYLGAALRGSGRRPFGSDMGVPTHGGSVRYPDLSVSCERTPGMDDDDHALAAPCVVFEVLSPTTRRADRGVKLDEYRVLQSVELVVLVDPVTERLRVLRRTGPHAWDDRDHREPHDLEIPSLGLVVPHAEIFARD